MCCCRPYLNLFHHDAELKPLVVLNNGSQAVFRFKLWELQMLLPTDTVPLDEELEKGFTVTRFAFAGE